MYFGKRVIEGENNAMKTPRHPEGGLSHILSAGTRGKGGGGAAFISLLLNLHPISDLKKSFSL